MRPWKAPATSVVPGFCSPRGEVGVPGHEQLDAHQQLADRHVLREEVVGADLQRAVALLVLVRARDEEQRHAREQRVVAHAAAELEAVHLRHGDVGEDHPGPVLHGELPGRRAVRRLVDREALGGERHGEVLAEGRVLVRDQHRAQHRRHGVEVGHVLVHVAPLGARDRERRRDLVGDLAELVRAHPALEAGVPHLRVLGDRGEDEVDEVLDVDRAALRAVEEVQPLVAAQPVALRERARPGPPASAARPASRARGTPPAPGRRARGASNFAPAGIGGGTFIAAGAAGAAGFTVAALGMTTGCALMTTVSAGASTGCGFGAGGAGITTGGGVVGGAVGFCFAKTIVEASSSSAGGGAGAAGRADARRRGRRGAAGRLRRTGRPTAGRRCGCGGWSAEAMRRPAERRLGCGRAWPGEHDAAVGRRRRLGRRRTGGARRGRGRRRSRPGAAGGGRGRGAAASSGWILTVAWGTRTVTFTGAAPAPRPARRCPRRRRRPPCRPRRSSGRATGTAAS